MRSVLQKEISYDALRCEIGDLPDLDRLLRRLYEGRLSDRNRSMVVLASRRGLSSRMISSFLDIDNKSCRKYLQRFERGASWHIAKRLSEHIGAHNAVAAGGAGPIIETVPLPSGAQFLNVIESVFSGMARAIIHNSDYQTLDEAKTAINRYFEERNAHFRQHPRRAGKKIWGKERAPATFSEANNCKDPRYR